MGVVRNILPFVSIPFTSMLGPILLGFAAAGVVFGALGGIISISKYLRKEGGEIFGW